MEKEPTEDTLQCLVAGPFALWPGKMVIPQQGLYAVPVDAACSIGN